MEQPQLPRPVGAHRSPEQQVDQGRRGLLIAGGLALASVIGGGIAARMNHLFGWGETEPAAPLNPGDTDQTASASPEDGVALPPEFNKEKAVDVAGKGTWKFVPGTEADPKGGLDIKVLGLSLRPQVGTDVYSDASQAIPVETVGRYGTHLQTGKGDFGITARLSSIEAGKEASVAFHAAPELMFDERVEPSAGLKVTATAEKVTVTVLGKDGRAGQSQEIPLAHGADHTDFWVKQMGGQLVVGCNGKTTAFSADFFKASGNVWFGFDGSEGSAFHVDELKAYPIGAGEAKLVDTSTVELGKPLPNGFQTIAGDKLTIGTALDLTPVVLYPQVAELVGNQVGAIKPEMLGKMQAILPGGPDKDGNIRDEDYNWAELDAFVDLAARNGKKVHMHTLIFGEALSPKTEQFLKDVAEGRIPRSAATNFMESYITTFVKRYKDRVKEWDVVNEPLESTDSFDKAAGRVYRKNAWYKAFGGTEYVRVACEAAKKAGAEKVFINENGAETNDDRAQALLDLAVPLRNQGYVDGVGLQAHLDSGPGSDIDNWSENGVAQESYVFDDMTTRFNQFKAARLEVQISEFSIDSDNPHEQAVVSHGMMRAARHASNVTAIYWWGLVTGPFYMTSENSRNGNDAPWDWKNGQPVQKETVGGIQQGLRA